MAKQASKHGVAPQSGPRAHGVLQAALALPVAAAALAIGVELVRRRQRSKKAVAVAAAAVAAAEPAAPLARPAAFPAPAAAAPAEPQPAAAAGPAVAAAVREMEVALVMENLLRETPHDNEPGHAAGGPAAAAAWGEEEAELMRQRLIQLMPSSDEDEGVHSASGAATASATSSREREGEAAAPAAPPSPELAALLRANALLPGGADEVAAAAWGLPQARPKQRGAALSYLRSTYLGRTLSSLGRDPADEERYRALVQDRPPAFDAAGVVRLANMAGVRIAEGTDLEGVTPQQAQQAAETLGASVELRRVMLCSAIADRNLRRRAILRLPAELSGAQLAEQAGRSRWALQVLLLGADREYLREAGADAREFVESGRLLACLKDAHL